MRHLCRYPSTSTDIFPGIYRCDSCGSTWAIDADENGKPFPSILDETELHKQLARSIEMMLKERNAKGKTSI